VELLVARCAGLDVATDELVACVRCPTARRPRPAGAGVPGLHPLPAGGAGGVAGRRGVTQVVVGPPASGGKPAWWVLEERGFALLLVSARHGKLLAGRKADVGDAAWLAELLECGRLRASFVPRPRSVSCATPARERQRLVQAHAAEASASRRTLEDAGTKLDSVATGVGVPRAGRCWRRWSPGSATLGCWPGWPGAGCAPSSPGCARRCGAALVATQALLVRLAVRTSGQLEASIAEPDAQVERVLAPFAPGPGPAGHDYRGGQAGGAGACSPGSGWAWRCSRPRRTWRRGRAAAPGGQPHPGASAARASPPGQPVAGWGADLGAPGRRRAAAAAAWRPATGGWRAGSASRKAAVAVGHSILVVAWRLFTDDGGYQDLGGEDFVRRGTDRQRQRAVAQLQALGDRVVLEPLAAQHPGIHVSGCARRWRPTGWPAKSMSSTCDALRSGGRRARLTSAYKRSAGERRA
jgi:transposase